MDIKNKKKPELDSISGKSVIVVAHPDDEVLWFSSILEKVDHIIFCYADVPGNHSLTDSRRIMAKTYPLDNVSHLGIDESGAFNNACWNEPAISSYGLELEQHGSSSTKYELAFPDLVSRLEAELAHYQTVFTHSPWGEYGNEEHVQVNHAVQMAQSLLGFDYWCPGYVSAKSDLLMKRYDLTNVQSMTCSIDQELKENYAEYYRQCGCWTWYDDWERFDNEVFYKNIELKAEMLPGVQHPQINRVRADRGYANRMRGSISKEELRKHAKHLIPRIMYGHTFEKSGHHYQLLGTASQPGAKINDSAAIILGLCDGKNTVVEITELLSAEYSISIEKIEADIHSCLLEYFRRDVIAISVASSDASFCHIDALNSNTSN